METKEITIKDKKIVLKQLNYFDVIETATIENKREHAKKIFLLSGVPEEMLNNELMPEEGAKLMEAINELNGWGFQKPSVIENKS